MSRSSFRPQLEQLGDRALPSGTLSINDVAHVARLGGPTAFAFTVHLSQPTSQPVSVNYATADGTATAAEKDYVPTKGTLKFAKGQTVATITVPVNAPTTAEPDETFQVRLSNPSHATIADGTGVGTIQEPVPTAGNDTGGPIYQYQTTGGNVLINDLDPAGGGLRVGTVNGSAANVGTTIRLPSGALLTVRPDGPYTYDPEGAFDSVPPGQSTTDTFTYTATDALGTRTNTATVTITVVHPVFAANDDSTWTYPDTPVSPYSVLSNDIDPTGGGLTVSAVNGSAANIGATIQLPSGALLTFNADGSYTYDPNGAFNYLWGTGGMATDSFTYTVTDSLGEQATATVTISIYDPSYGGGGGDPGGIAP